MTRRGDLKDLPTSFYLNGLIDVLAITKYNNRHVTCENCEQKYSESSQVFVFSVVCFTAPSAKMHTTSCKVIKITVSWLKEFQDKDFGHVLKRPVFCPESWLKNEELKY